MKINCYSRNELACMYMPNLSMRSAQRQLNLWLTKNERLKQRLLKAGADEKTRFYTPRQVEIIFEELGEPYIFELQEKNF